MSALGTFASYLAKGEFGKIGTALGERVPVWLSHSGKAYLFELNRSGYRTANSKSTLPTGYLSRIATRDEMTACGRITGHDVSEFYRRFDAGDLCYAVFVQDRPVNINWVHTGTCYVRGMGYVLEAGPTDKYIYGIMTDPSERGKGLYKNCLIDLAAKLFDEGAERLIQMVEDGNKPVLVTLPQLGYNKTHEIHHWTVCGIKRTVTTDLSSGQSTTSQFLTEPKQLFVI